MKKNYISLLFFGLFSITCWAKFYEPESDARFYRHIERHAMTIVFFDPYAVTDDNQEKLQEMDSAFERLSRRDRYKDADVAFVAVELDEVPALIEDFRLSIEKPTIMLFRNGKVIKKGDEIFKDVGFLNKAELEDLIEEYFGKDIESKLARKKEIERIRQETRQEQVQQEVPVARTVPVSQPTTTQTEYVTTPVSTSTTYVYDDGYSGYGGYGGPYVGIGVLPWGGRRYWGGGRPWRGGRGWGGGGRGRGWGGGRRGGFGGRGGGGRGGRGRR